MSEEIDNYESKDPNQLAAFSLDEMTLKTGRIKYMSFKNNPEAFEITREVEKIDREDGWPELYSQEAREKLCEAIDAFDGVIWSWWEDRQFTKEEAKEYILNYPVD